MEKEQPEQVTEQPSLPAVAGEKPITIITVDNGWGAAEFQRIVNNCDDTSVRKILMTKGVSLMRMPGIEVIPYEESLKSILEEGTIALFTRVGEANINEFKKILEAGIPVVVHVQHCQGVIEHQVNGYVYGDDSWAIGWLNTLIDSKEVRDKISSKWSVEKSHVEKEIKVSVITPTWKRDEQIISRSIDSLRLQTFQNWEQLVCSNGEYEPNVEELVKNLGDDRVSYNHVGPVGENDFGNTARKTMIDQISGEFVMFLDDDNIILPEYIEKMIGALDAAGDDIGFAICKIMHFGPLNEAVIGKPPQVLSGVPVKLFYTDPLQVFVRCDVMKSIGWDTEVGYVGDGITLENLGKQYAYVEVPEVLGIHV